MLQNKKLLIRSQEDHWIPLSDLMSGLMMIFLLVAIIFMIQVQRDAKKLEVQAEVVKEQAEVAKKQAEVVKESAVLYGDLREQLYQDLSTEFKDDLPRWDAVLTRDLAIRFKEPRVQFDTGSAAIKPTFSAILDSFFPRYIRILDAEKYRNEIEEIRIEGHTSSNWEGRDAEHAYYENMRLSQDRTRTVLEYVLSIPKAREHLSWILPRLTANGLSSAHRIFLADGSEDKISSQRVEFKVRTNAEDRLSKIVKTLPR
jgi:outer membrane protein OmpA-like peptidoglycan-associated protein